MVRRRRKRRKACLCTAVTRTLLALLVTRAQPRIRTLMPMMPESSHPPPWWALSGWQAGPLTGGGGGRWGKRWRFSTCVSVSTLEGRGITSSFGVLLQQPVHLKNVFVKTKRKKIIKKTF